MRVPQPRKPLREVSPCKLQGLTQERFTESRAGILRTLGWGWTRQTRGDRSKFETGSARVLARRASPRGGHQREFQRWNAVVRDLKGLSARLESRRDRVHETASGREAGDLEFSVSVRDGLMEEAAPKEAPLRGAHPGHGDARPRPAAYSPLLKTKRATNYASCLRRLRSGTLATGLLRSLLSVSRYTFSHASHAKSD